MKVFSKIIFSSALIIAMFVFTTSLHAATKTPVATPQIPPQIILTWNASNFYPSNFRGKALPSIGTPITISASLLMNGKFVDTSNAKFVWYKSGDKLTEGDGLNQITSDVGTDGITTAFFDVEVTLGDAVVNQSLAIPSTQPVVAIEIPYPRSTVDINANVLLRAVPYFFNVTSLDRLVFYWQVGDIKKNMGSTNAISLKISAPYSASQKNVAVSSYVQSKDDLTNITKTNTNLFIR